MNAHQRRKQRRKKVVFDMEVYNGEAFARIGKSVAVGMRLYAASIQDAINELPKHLLPGHYTLIMKANHE